MIQAYITIGLKSGMKVQYVRDVVNDSKGQGGRLYKYNGPAHQDLNLENRKIVPKEVIVPDTNYYFKLNVNNTGLVEYFISFPKRDEPTLHNKNEIINFSYNDYATYDSIVFKLNQETKHRGVLWSLTPRGDIRCQNTSKDAATAILLAPGTTGIDLLSTLGATLKTPVAGDQLSDQTGAGKVLGDFLSITENMRNFENKNISYVSGTTSGIYNGDLKKFLTSFDTRKLKVYLNGLLNKESELLESTEEIAGGELGEITTDEVFDESYVDNFVLVKSGDNEGEIRQIVSGVGGVFVLDSPLPNETTIGDTYEIYTSYDYFVLDNGILFASDTTAGDYIYIQQNDALNGFLIFPESDGDIDLLSRKNDNDDSITPSQITTRIPVNSISEIAIIEKKSN